MVVCVCVSDGDGSDSSNGGNEEGWVFVNDNIKSVTVVEVVDGSSGLNLQVEKVVKKKLD